MPRIKSLLVAAAVAGAVFSFIRIRLGGPQSNDPGGWRPVDPT